MHGSAPTDISTRARGPGIYCEIPGPENIRNTPSITFHQNGCLHKAWTRKMPANMLMLNNKDKKYKFVYYILKHMINIEIYFHYNTYIYLSL